MRNFKILFVIFSLIIFASCTRKSADLSSRLTIQFPNADKSTVNNVVSQKQVPTISGKPNFNYQLVPTTYSDVDCIIVFIGGPEDSMSNSYCEKSEDKSQHFKFGMFAGTVAKNQTVSLEVPSGSSRYVRMYGLKKSDPSRACPTVAHEGSDDGLEGFSAPFFIGESAPTEMAPGATVTVNVPIVASIDSKAFFDDCRGPSFGSNDGPGGGDDGSSPNSPYVRLEGFHSFNSVENPSFHRKMARGACYPVTFKAFQPCNGGVCVPYVLNSPATFNLGNGIKFFATEATCQSDSSQQMSVTIPAGQSQFPITGSYYMRVPIGNIGMVTTNLQGEVSLQPNSEVSFTQSAHTHIEIDKPKISFANIPSSLTFGSCASGANSTVSIFEDNAGAFPMNSHEIFNLDTVYLEARALGCGAQITNILPNLATVSFNVGKPAAGLSGFDGAVKAIYYDPMIDKYYVGGQFTTFGGHSANNIVRLYSDGRLDLNFKSGNGFDGFVSSIISDGVGGVIVGGAFSNYNGMMASRVVRLHPDGQLNLNFSVQVIGAQVNALLLRGNFLYVGGQSITTVGGASRTNLAQIDMATGNVTSWAPNPNNSVMALAGAGSSIYVGGNFTTIGGQSRNRLAEVNESTGVPTAWNPNVNAVVNAMEISGSNLIFGGNFTTVNGGTTRNRLAAVDLSAGSVLSWNPNVNAMVNALKISGSTVYLAGGFTSVYGGTTRNRVAAVDVSTGSPFSWNPDVSTGSGVYAITAANSSVVFGGSFTAINASTRATGNFAAVDQSVGNHHATELNSYWGMISFNPLLFNNSPVYVSP